MALRRVVGCLPALILAICACKGDDKGSAVKGALALGSVRCEPLAKSCSDDKHVAKLVEECTKAASKLAERGCTQQATALYGCYETRLCGKQDKVWTLDDLRVLAERHQVCAAEREALRGCVAR